MSSQILTEIHANNGATLEKQIHDCPNGMNKLLLRLPDLSREEVRNQSLVLVQQLTLKNEEMKKTVVFNDGFSIIFGIILQEGGSGDGGVVVQDCLKICKNLLTESEPCQRFFYGMGSEWILSLNEFFDAQLLENLPRNASLDDSGIEVNDMIWFDQPGRLACAVLSLDAISSSLSIPNAKHQSLIGISISGLIPTAAFWIARKGPDNIVNASLSLLERVVEGNETVSESLANVLIKFTTSVQGKNVPIGYEQQPLQFGWKPLSNDDRKYITLLSLLVERYIYSSHCWSSSIVNDDLNKDLRYDTNLNDGLSQGCIKVLEKILAAYPTINDLTIQHVLAPPPPSDESGEMENVRPLGSLVLNILVESCTKIIDHISTNISLQGQIYKSDIEIAERAANIFALFFIYGGQLSRELSTVINTSHVVQGIPAQPLLPFLLATTGRAARAQSSGNSSPTLLVALLRMLATAVSGCEKAAKLILVDPSNLFVVDLATVASENAGVPSSVQITACLFLGMCFLALPVSEEGSSGQEERLTRRSFVSMIDSKIGLTRFTDILKRPILNMASINRIVGINNLGMSSDIFFTKGFRAFYETQIESIRSGIFDFYAGENTSVTDSAHLQIIEMQKEKIFELESQIQLLQTNQSINQINGNNNEAEKQLQDINTDNELTKLIEHQKNQIESFIKNEASLSIENDNLQVALKTTEATLNDLQMKYLHQSSGSSDEILGLKQSILQLDTERNQLKDILKQRDKKIQLLEGELKGPVPSEIARDKKIADLEVRNAELKQQLWQAEANISSQSQFEASINWTVIGDSLKNMISKLGMQESDFDIVVDNSQSCSDRVLKIDNVIRNCTENIVLAIGNCSDIAEAVGFKGLDGEEGSINRLKDCTEKVATRLAEREEEMEEIVRKYEILLRDLDQLKMEKKSFETDMTGNKDIDNLKIIISEQKESIKNIQSENDILMAQYNDSASRFNEEIMVLKKKEHGLVSLNDEKDAEIVRLKKLVDSNTSSTENLSASTDSIQQRDEEIIKLTNSLETIENSYKESAHEKDEEIIKLTNLYEILISADKEKDVIINELRVLLETKESEIQCLKDELSACTEEFENLSRESLSTYNENSNLKKDIDDLKRKNEEVIGANKPFHVQDMEQQLSRLTNEATRLAQELQDRDLENQRLQELNQKKEGELAGVMSSMQALQVETDSISNELTEVNNVSKSKETELAELRRSYDSVSCLLELETSQTEQLRDTIEKLERDRDNTKMYEVIQFIRFMITHLSDDNSDHKDEFSEDSNIFSLVYKLKGLVEGIDIKYHQKSPVKNFSPMQTPAKIKNESIVTPISGIEKRGRGVTAFISSPAAKEMSRLHAEISLERRRLQVLQEQHSDLLGLLAQQEVELVVFKDVLEQYSGNEAVSHAEDESKRITVEKYGFYVDYRSTGIVDEIEDDDDDNDNGRLFTDNA